MEKQLILINFVILIQLVCGLYIRPVNEMENKNRPISDSEWNVFKSKLGLTDNKIEILKTQKDQKATAELLKRYMKENPKYTTVHAEDPKLDSFHNAYKDMLKQLQATKGVLKASLNFELAEKPHKNFKRSTRKIAVKLVSDIPSDKIDDLLRMFNERHGLKDDDSNEDLVETSDDDNEIQTVPMTTDSDYMYENLWEDEEVQNPGDTTNRNPQLGSFQDLIMKASRQRWQREMEETKFNNEHFV